MASILALSGLVSLGLAQTTTLSLAFYGYDQMPIVGSVVSANDQATTISLACQEGTDASDCGLFPVQVLTVGPSTYHMDMSAPGGGFTGIQDCSSTVCTESYGGSEANFPGSSTTTYDSIESMPVTVTAGADKLGSGGAAATTSGGSTAATASSGSGASQTTASVTSVSGSASSSAAASGSATDSAASMSSSSAASSQVSIVQGGVLVAALGLLGSFMM